MSDPKTTEPDEDLLEFLGGIDEVNEDSSEGGFADFLARREIDTAPAEPRPPAKEEK